MSILLASQQVLAYMKAIYPVENTSDLSSISSDRLNHNFDKAKPITEDELRISLKQLSKPEAVVDALVRESNAILRSFFFTIHRKVPSTERKLLRQEAAVVRIKNRFRAFIKKYFYQPKLALWLMNSKSNKVVLGSASDDFSTDPRFDGLSEKEIMRLARIGRLTFDLAGINLNWFQAIVTYANASQYTNDGKAIIN